MPQPTLKRRWQFLWNLGLFSLLMLITGMITVIYVSYERNFHWWIDWYYRTIEVVAAWRESPTTALKVVWQSLGEERNKVYTLPLVPFILLFGESRLVYELGLAWVYLLPFSLVMGAIATQLIPTHSFAVFWSTAGLSLLIPVTWVPTFLGIPDTGAALFIALAALVYLQDVRFLQAWRIPVIGVLLALAIIVRRHFAYGAIAFFDAVSLQALMFFFAEVRHKPRIAWRNLLLVSIRIGLIFAISLTTLVTVTWEFTYRALIIDYKSLYVSWSLPFDYIVRLYASFYGWATWLLVAIGFFAGIFTRVLSLPTVSLIGLSGIFSIIIWLVILRYGNVFYTLHVTPFIIMGLTAFIWTICIRLTRKARTLILSIAGCYLVCNLIVGLTLIGNFDSFLRPLFALNIPPLVRTDYDEVVRLVQYLRQLTPHYEPIYVVGYQRLQLNSSTVRAAERILYGREHNSLNLLIVPQVDSQDFYPLEKLLQAQYVVVPNPLPDFRGDFTKVPAAGEWLFSQEYDVVKVVFNALTQNWKIAQDFQRLPVQFSLAGGTVVSIYQRIHPTSIKTAVQTLTRMQQQIGERPGGQLDWITLSQWEHDSLVIKNFSKTYKLVAHSSDVIQDKSFANIYISSDQEPVKSFLYLNAIPEKATITGIISSLDKNCVSASLRLAMLDQKGDVVSSTENRYFPNYPSKFRLAVQSNSPAYLMLNVKSYDRNDLIGYCPIEIQSLKVSQQK